MRTLNKNKQKLWYGICQPQEPIYQMDLDGNIEYMDIDGEKVPIEIGMRPSGYSVTEFRANIATSGGEAEAVEFGIDQSAYSAKMLCQKSYIPIDETSLIWDKEPTLNENGLAEANTASYRVVGIYPSLNFVVYLLDKTTSGYSAARGAE